MNVRTGTEMCAIRAGRVTVSDRRTRRGGDAGLAPSPLAAFPVTQALYAQVTGERSGPAHRDRLPVACVSWWDGSADGFRLPAEADGSLPDGTHELLLGTARRQLPQGRHRLLFPSQAGPYTRVYGPCHGFLTAPELTALTSEAGG